MRTSTLRKSVHQRGEELRQRGNRRWTQTTAYKGVLHGLQAQVQTLGRHGRACRADSSTLTKSVLERNTKEPTETIIYEAKEKNN